MIYPSINEKLLQDTLKQYEERGEKDCISYKLILERLDKKEKFYQKTNCKQVNTFLNLCRDNIDLFDPNSLEVINKLLGDTKLKRKFRDTCDGSYLNNRIWLYVNPRSCLIEMRVEINFTNDESVKSMSSKEKIDYMYNHFDAIYLQFENLSNRFDMLHMIKTDLETYEIDSQMTYSMIRKACKGVIM